jgi:hypothetical protein
MRPKNTGKGGDGKKFSSDSPPLYPPKIPSGKLRMVPPRLSIKWVGKVI